MKLTARLRLLGCLTLALLALLCAGAAAEEISGQSELELFTAGDFPQQQLVQTYAVENLGDYLFSQMTAQKKSIDLRTYQLQPEELVAVLSDVLNNEPSLFYIGAHVEYYISSTTGYVTRYLPEYLYTGDDLNARIDAFNAAVGEIADYALAATTDVGKLLLVNDYFCTHFEYDAELTIYSPDLLFSEKTGVCQAYMLGYAAVLDRLGITNTHATSSEMSHTWNMVRLDDTWYHIDVTWNDPLPDRLLRAYHSTFLLSDAGIAASSHYNWSASEVADDPRYDDCFWRSICTPLAVTGETIYHISNVDASGRQSVIRRNMADGSAETIHTFSIVGDDGTYPVWNNHAAVCADSENVYYAARGQFYALPLDGSEPVLMYTTGSDDVLLLGSYLEDGSICAVAASSVNEYGVRCTFPVDSALELHVEPLLRMPMESTAQLHASLSPAPLISPQLTWESADVSVAGVDETGLVSALSTGAAVVSVRGGGFEASCLVVVYEGELLSLPANTSVIGDEAFSGAALRNAVLPEGVLSIGARAFADCEQIHFVFIPGSVECIDDDAFSGAENAVLICPENSLAAGFAADHGLCFQTYS